MRMHSHFLILLVYVVVFECLSLQCLVPEGGKAKNEGGENEREKHELKGTCTDWGKCINGGCVPLCTSVIRGIGLQSEHGNLYRSPL